MDCLKIGVIEMHKGKNVVDDKKLSTESSNYRVSFRIQIVLTVLLLVCMILSFFINEMVIAVDVLLCAVFLFMAYHNVKVIKKKGLGLIYVFIAIYALVLGIVRIYGL